mmetsp:Transcript_80444/g.233502  ORF Transcript_80444/g.233502 Transcript_80444/m.233502 type:complete len:234 (+) Transcript_80444:1073-1774(+)
MSWTSRLATRLCMLPTSHHNRCTSSIARSSPAMPMPLLAALQPKASPVECRGPSSGVRASQVPPGSCVAEVRMPLHPGRCGEAGESLHPGAPEACPKSSWPTTSRSSASNLVFCGADARLQLWPAATAIASCKSSNCTDLDGADTWVASCASCACKHPKACRCSPYRKIRCSCSASSSALSWRKPTRSLSNWPMRCLSSMMATSACCARSSNNLWRSSAFLFSTAAASAASTR